MAGQMQRGKQKRRLVSEFAAICGDRRILETISNFSQRQWIWTRRLS